MSNCKECSSKEKCTKCNSGYYLVNDNSCMTYDSINNDQYLSLDGITYKSCSYLIPNCKRCDNNTYCKECYEEYIFVYDYANPRCEDDLDVEDIPGIYYDPNSDIFRSCNQNNSHCSECSNERICTKCENGYNSITLCNQNLIICITENEINNYQYNQGNKCYNKCTVQNCEECPNNINECKKCSNNYTILNNNPNNCILKSSLGNTTFTNDSGIHYYNCDTKISNCNICSNNGTICNQCYSNFFFLDQDYTQCNEENNLINTYGNKIFKFDQYNYYSCNKGVNNCETCSNKSYCNSCKNNYGLICDENNYCHPINTFENKYFKTNNCYKKCSDYGCEECTSDSNCSKCIDNYELYGKKCYSKESIGEKTCLNSNGVIKNCSEEMSNCIYCKGCNICTNCIGNNVVIYENDNSFICKDISTLNNEYYLNISRNIYYPCYMALNNCRQCSNQNICLSCLNYYALLFEEDLTSKCVTEDNIDKKKYLLNPDSNEKKYYPCSFYFPNCDSCINTNKCEKCKDGFGFINWDNSKCENINNNEICEIENGKNYVSCSGNILFCKSSEEDNCNECIEDYTIYNNNTKECSEIKYDYKNSKKYYTPDNGIHYYSCNYLISGCDKCSSEKICNECKAGFVVVDDENCEELNTLNTTLYYTDDGYHYYTCSKQIDNCLTCQGKNICSKCQENYTLLDRDYSKCLESKNYENNDEYYSNDNGINYYTCYNLINNCKRCSDEKTCIECFNDFVTINNDLNKCINENDIDNNNCEKENDLHYICYYNVIENCKTYLNIKKENCSECEKGYSIISNDNSKCKLEDNYKNNNSYYTNNEGKNYYKCSEKIENCEKCLNNGNKCTKCENNYYFINENYNVCINENTFEEYNYYKKNDLEYYKCDYKGVNNCEKCYSGNHCIQCKEKYTLLDEDYTQCNSIENLNNQYYKEDEYHYKSCHKVITGCEECLNSTYCTKCSNYYILKDDHSKCDWNQSIGNQYVIDKDGNQRKCSDLMENCIFCISENICTLCNTGLLAEELDKSRHCLKDNNNKEYYSIHDDKGIIYYPCKRGVSHCQICELKDYCILCENPFARIFNNYSYCFSEEEINEFGNEYVKINNTDYYPCNYFIDNCKQCLNNKTCTLCEDNYSFLNDDHSKCYSQDDLTNYCSEDNGINYYNCEGGVIHCNEAYKTNKCEKCKNNYTLLNSDLSKCIKIDSLIPIEHYFTTDNQIHYTSCDHEIDYCNICSENNGNIKCNTCNDNYGLINSRNKCYNINEKLNTYYLTKDEDNNYLFKNCINYCKICTNGETCDECVEQFHFKRNKCIGDLECKLKIIYEDLSLDSVTFEQHIKFLNEQETSTAIIIIGPNNEYNISIYNDDICTEILLKNNFITFYFLESSKKNDMRRLEELNNDLNSLYKVIIKDNINKKTSFRVFTNETEEVNIQKIYSNYIIEKNLTNSFINNSKTIELIKTFEKKKINIFDENERIFNDICEPLSTNHYDIPLKDRKLLLLLNKEKICGNSCTLTNIFYEDLIYNCNCEMQENIEFSEDDDILNTIFKKLSTSSKIKDYFKYLGCKLESKKLKSNGGFYFSLILLIMQIFLSILYFVMDKNQIKTVQSNPPIKFRAQSINKEYEHESASNIIQVNEIKIIEKYNEKNYEDQDNKKIEENKTFFSFYKEIIIEKFIFCKFSKMKNQKMIKFLLHLIFILSLSFYICSLSIHQNYISEKYFTNKNRILFEFKSQLLPIIIFILISFIGYYGISFAFFLIEKITPIFSYLIIISIILMTFFFISVTQFCSIYPETIEDLFIRFFTFIVLFNILKMMIFSIILMIFFKMNDFENEIFKFFFK